MKVGDLVVVNPARIGFYVITSIEAYDPMLGVKVPHCVTLVSTDNTADGPMNKKWNEVVAP